MRNVAGDTVTPASSSVTVTVTTAMRWPSYRSSLSASTTAWEMAALSFAASESWAARTVTVCAVLQLAVVKVKVAGDTVTSVLSLLTDITTSDAASVSRSTV